MITESQQQIAREAAKAFWAQKSQAHPSLETAILCAIERAYGSGYGHGATDQRKGDAAQPQRSEQQEWTVIVSESGRVHRLYDGKTLLLESLNEYVAENIRHAHNAALATERQRRENRDLLVRTWQDNYEDLNKQLLSAQAAIEKQ